MSANSLNDSFLKQSLNDRLVVQSLSDLLFIHILPTRHTYLSAIAAVESV